MKIINIEAIDIPDAWFQCVSSVLEKCITDQGKFIKVRCVKIKEKIK